MKHTPADVTASVLIDLGLANVSGSWPVSVGDLPDGPDSVLSVRDTAGFGDGRSMTDGELQSHYGVQIIVRSGLYKDGGEKLYQIREALSKQVIDRVVMIESNQYRVGCYSRFSDVIALGKETPTSRRDLFSLNLTVTITPL